MDYVQQRVAQAVSNQEAASKYALFAMPFLPLPPPKAAALRKEYDEQS
jgi:hypothetical protein